MLMFKKPRTKEDIIERLQKLGFKWDADFPDGQYILLKHNKSTGLIISEDAHQFRYFGPEGTATHESETFEREKWYLDILNAIYIPLIKEGTLVVYDPGYKLELGKVKRINPHDENKVFVWYHSGDTAACTNMENLYPVTEEFALKHKDMFRNAYAIEEIINKEMENKHDRENKNQ